MRPSIVSKDVIRALQSGKEWAFDIVFEIYNTRVFGLAIKMGLPKMEAEGVLQETFIAIWDKRRSLDPNLSFNSLVLTIAKRQTIKVIRSNASRAQRNEHMRYLMPTSYEGTEDYVIYKEMLKEAKEKLDSLPKKQKQIWMLSKEEGLSSGEIADRLNLTKRTVENHLFRANKDIKDFLKQKKSN
ncbi:MAG: sigma-70 family RNA polymerase sigma factor [Bacteroidota bacterium]